MRPPERHGGIGGELIADSIERVRRYGGKKILIGIIDKNEILKNWYKKKGFIETGKKDFEHLPFRVCFLEYSL